MPESLKRLISMISYLPGIGEKSATKLAFFMLNSNKNYLDNFEKAISDIQNNIGKCSTCHSLVDAGRENCSICTNETRKSETIIVVEEYLDLLSIEQTGIFDGKYHILGGAISPINGVFASDLNFDTLISRVEHTEGKIELILGTNPNIEGEATNAYIKEAISKKGLSHKVTITKLSRGLSSGYIEYADNITLTSALKDRKEI